MSSLPAVITPGVGVTRVYSSQTEHAGVGAVRVLSAQPIVVIITANNGGGRTSVVGHSTGLEKGESN